MWDIYPTTAVTLHHLETLFKLHTTDLLVHVRTLFKLHTTDLLVHVSYASGSVSCAVSI